jgi:hypothetical protein
MDPQHLRELSAKIIANPNAIYDLSTEETAAVHKHLNPLGNVIADKKTYANMSVINIREQWMRRFLMTSTVGFIYRTLEEYKPYDDIEAAEKKLRSALDKCPNDEAKRKQLNDDHNAWVKKVTAETQSTVRKFLDRNFEFDPDRHVRTSHGENKADPERRSKAELIRKTCDLRDKQSATEAKLQASPEKLYMYVRSNLLTTYQTLVKTSETLNAALTTILDPEVSLSDKQGILMKKYIGIKSTIADMKKVVEPILAAETLPALQVSPPADIFHHFDRYITNHYEQLREVTEAVFSEKPDIENAIIFYNSFKTPEAARDHRNQHESEFRSEVFTIENSGITLLGPFKENRKRVDFYNRNTEILKRMMEQVEADHRLGEDLMKKQVKTKKAKNIAEMGPDAPGLSKYVGAMNMIQEMGVKKGLTREEQEELARAVAIKEDFEVPEDAIQVDVFHPTEEGGLGKTKFYTQAEAPLHLQENSPFGSTYQPVRVDGMTVQEAYVRRTVKDNKGKEVEIMTITPDATTFVQELKSADVAK